jgi:Na+/glutamate symporter
MLMLIVTPILILAFCFIIGIVIGLIKSRKDLLDIWRNLLTIVTAYLKNTKVVGYGLISISLFLLASLFPPILIVYLLVAGIWFIKK